jgi:hypothetical protein
MTPISAGPALSPIDCPQVLPTSTSELVSASLSDGAPWLYSALSQLHELERSGENMLGVGDLRISDAASAQLRTLLSSIEVKSLPSPTLYPISGRGVGLRWDVGQREVEFTIFDNGATVIAKLENAQLLDDCELAAHPPAEFNNFLRWLVAAR